MYRHAIAQFGGIEPSDEKYLSLLGDGFKCCPNLANLYANVLQQWHVDERRQANLDPVRFLYPLLEYRAEHSRLTIATIAAEAYKYLNGRGGPTEDPFKTIWVPVRLLIENLPQSFGAFCQYRKLHIQSS